MPAWFFVALVLEVITVDSVKLIKPQNNTPYRRQVDQLKLDGYTNEVLLHVKWYSDVDLYT